MDPDRPVPMEVELTSITALRFGPGDPVRAASGVTRFGDGWIVAQDDANHAAWWRGSEVSRIRLFPPTDGADLFSEAAGTKHLKPDIEAACAVEVAGRPGALLLGSGSLPARTRAALVVHRPDGPAVDDADLAPLYDAVAAALSIRREQLNLEGACAVGDRVRWFQRGHGRSGVPSASVDLDARQLVAAVRGTLPATSIQLRHVRRYELGTLAGFALTITDAVALPDGRILVAAAAEDAPDAVADGPVAGSALAMLRGGDVSIIDLPPDVRGRKIEGLAMRGVSDDGVLVLAVVDADDPELASIAVELRLRW